MIARNVDNGSTFDLECGRNDKAKKSVNVMMLEKLTSKYSTVKSAKGDTQ